MTKKFRPLVQVVIAIHRYERPIERAVASVVEGNTTNGAIVWCTILILSLSANA